MEKEYQQLLSDSQQSEQQILQQNITKYIKSRQTNVIKKVIVVIGKMGHGKSSFIKMLVSEQDKPNVKVGEGVQSVTNTCDLFELSIEAKNKLNIQENQPIYALDTPGMNSQAKNYLIMEQVRKIIFIQKCQIIGIAYLKNSTDCRQDLNSSYIEFHKIFPVKKSIKEELSFFIFTNLDKQIFNMKSFQNGKKTLKQSFLKEGLSFIQKRQVNWISYPSNQEDKQSVIELVKQNKKATELQKKQWSDLGQILKSRHKIKCSFQEFQKGGFEYRKQFKLQILKALKSSSQFAFDLMDFNFKTNTEDKIDSGLKIVGAMGVSTGIVGGGAFTVGITFGWFIAPLAIGVGLLAVGCKYYQIKLNNRINNVFNFINNKINLFLNSLQEKQEQQFNKLSIQLIKDQCLSDMLSIKNEKEKYFTFKKSQFIQKINVKKRKCKMQQKQQQFVNVQLKQENMKLSSNETVKILKMQLDQATEYIFYITLKRPTQKVIQEVIRKVAFDVYYS